MTNSGVKCNVCECTHNNGCDCCDLAKIEITNKADSNCAVANPHFCKSYEAK